MKKKSTIILCALLMMILLCSCSTSTSNQSTSNAEVLYKDGTYTAAGDVYEDFGEVQLKDIVTVTVKDGKIASVDWNQEIKDGGDRQAISKESQDMVTRGGAQAPWYEQAALVTSHLIETQNVTPPDVISGVSIEIVDFFTLAKKALEQAK